MKEDTKIQIKKNILDIEYHNNFNYFLTCIILLTTILGIIVGVMSIYGKTFADIGNNGLAIIVVLLFVIVLFARMFRNRGNKKLEEIRGLLNGDNLTTTIPKKKPSKSK